MYQRRSAFLERFGLPLVAAVALMGFAGQTLAERRAEALGLQGAIEVVAIQGAYAYVSGGTNLPFST